jgi:hypothetical protein
MKGFKSKQSILWFVVLFTALTLMVGTHPSLAQNPKKGGILRCGLAGDIKSLTPFKVGHKISSQKRGQVPFGNSF